MSNDIKAAVFETIHEVLKPQNSPELAELVKQPDFRFRDISDSSLKLVEFCMTLEEKIDIEIEFSDLLDNATLQKFVLFLEKQSTGG